MNSLKITAALRALADAFEEGGQDAAPAAEPQKRGRGRPVKGEEQPATGASVPAAGSTSPAATAAAGAPSAATQTTAPASVVADDPFASAPTAAAPTATLEQVRAALTALRTASSQEKALAVLKKAGGADNLPGLTADKYGIVVNAVNVELRILENAKAPAAEADPFESAPQQAGEPAKVLTVEDVRAAAVAAGKRTSQDAVQKVVMSHGGKVAKAEGGEGPSLNALPADKYATVIAAINALPTTK